MKQALFTFAICALAVGTTLAQTKYGHVNTGLVLESLPVTAEADSLLRRYQDSLQVGFATLEGEFKRKYAEAEANYENLTPKQVQAAQKELQELQQELQVFQTEGARMFELRRGQYLTPIVDRVMATIKAYAKTNGYMLIFDSSLPEALVFVEESLDLTPFIIAELKEM